VGGVCETQGAVRPDPAHRFARGNELPVCGGAATRAAASFGSSKGFHSKPIRIQVFDDEDATMEGGCHCGRVRFRVTANLDRVTECNCSICKKKGFLHLIVSPAQFQLVNGKEELTAYEFNTRTAKHTFCKHCGIHPFYVPRSDPDKIDVNVRCSRRYRPCCDHAKNGSMEKNWEAAMQSGAPWR